MMTVRGCIDGLDGTHVSGWIGAPPDAIVRVTVTVDGSTVESTWSEVPRPDLAGIHDGLRRQGFRIAHRCPDPWRALGMGRMVVLAGSHAGAQPLPLWEPVRQAAVVAGVQDWATVWRLLPESATSTLTVWMARGRPPSSVTPPSALIHSACSGRRWTWCLELCRNMVEQVEDPRGIADCWAAAHAGRQRMAMIVQRAQMQAATGDRVGARAMIAPLLTEPDAGPVVVILDAEWSQPSGESA